MSGVVLDASAVMALLRDEPGADVVRRAVNAAFISTVNVCEVATRLVDHGQTPALAADHVFSLGLTIVAFDLAQAQVASALRVQTRARGLSPGDRACLALGKLRGLPVLTADRAWGELALDVKVVVIR